MLFLLVTLALLADEPHPPATAPSPSPAVEAPYWLRAPSVEEMIKAYPAEARAAGVGGRAEIDCIIAADGVLTACAVARELPEGQGFGAAALGLAPQMQLGAENRAGPRFAAGRVRIPFVWRTTACPALFPSVMEDAAPPESAPVRSWARPYSIISSPDWTRRPSAEDMVRYYPERAWRQRVAGKTVIRCTVTAMGTLSDCRIVSETPEGEDFGSASLKVARFFKIKPMTDDCGNATGATVRIPLVWRPSL